MRLSELNPNDILGVTPPASAPKKGGMRLSDLDPSEIVDVAMPEEKGLLAKTLEGIDRYGAAPMRAGYGKFQDSLLKKGIPMDVAGVAKAAYDQFGKDPASAPTAEKLVEQNPIGRQLGKQGVKDAFAAHPAALGIRGLLSPAVGDDRAKEIIGETPKVAAELLVGGETDPLSYVPGAVFEKPLMKGLELGAKGLSKTGKALPYLAEQTTGVPRELWSNYGKRSKEIAQLAKDYVGEDRYLQAFTDFRSKIGDQIAGRKNQLNEMIDKGLTGASRGAKVSIEPIIQNLDESMRGLHPVTEAGAIEEIQALKNTVKSIAPEGKMSPWDAYKLQRFFHNRSMSAFADGGKIFNPSAQSAKAAKGARYKSTEIVNKYFPDTIKRANQEYVSLHNIDDMIPPQMLDPNGSQAALRRAAIDPNSKERKALAQLSQFLHGDNRLLDGVKDLVTFEKMTNLPLNPMSGGATTSTSRTLLGAGVGALGEATDDPSLKWGARAAGATIASPALTKMAFDAGLLVPRGAKALAGKGGLLEKGAEKVSPMVKSLEKRLKGAGKTAKDFIDDEEGNFSPEDLLNILKPNEENVFDLKKARGLVGEPKKGLLSDKPADVVPHETPWRTVTPTDKEIAQRLGEKVFKRGEQLTVEELDFLSRLKNKIGGGRSENPELYSFKDAIEEAEQKHFGLRRKEFEAEQANKSLPKPTKESPKGLLTSLDVERGPVTERPEAGRQIGEIRMTKDGPKKVVHPTEGEIDAHVAGVNQKWMDEISKRIQGGGTPSKEDGERLFKLSQKFKNPELSDRAQQILDQWEVGIGSAEKAAEAERAKKGLIGVDFGGRGGKMPKAKPSGPAIGEVWNGPSGKKYTVLASETEGGKTYVKVEHVDVSGGPSDGKKITTWEEADDPKIFYGLEKRGESGPKGKRELIDALMSGEKKVPGISIKRGKENPNQGLIDDLWANREKRKPKPVDVPLGGSVELNVSMTNDGGASRPKYRVIESVDDMDGGGYLVENISTGETHTVSDSEIARVFDENGKLVSNKAKPKGGKGKPKKKKD
jgi:hypothetical protein